MRIVVELLLYEPGEMSAQDACIVRGVLRSVVSHFWVFAQRDAHARDLNGGMSVPLDASSARGSLDGADLLRQGLHVLPDEMITAWVVQHRETPWVAESDQM